MTEQDKEQLKEKVESWLKENVKLNFKEFENENFHFSYLVWTKKQGSNVGSNIIPIQVGYLKQLQQRQECILMGWGWTVDLKHYKVKTVMDNPKLRNALVEKLKQIINGNFRIKFLPNENSFSQIRVFTLIPVNFITKPIMHKMIIDLWLKYATMQFQFEKQYRWPAGWFDPSKHV
jgi:hypothetical protein